MIFVSTLYDVRRRVQGTEGVEREQDRQCINVTLRPVRLTNAAMGKQLNLGSFRFLHVYTAKDSPHLID